jgi:ketosteroid isomerase-like protein
MTAADTSQDARTIVRAFIDAFNDRDLDALRGLAADDVELRKLTGESLRGPDGLHALLAAAEDLELRLVPFRDPVVEGQDGRTRVKVALRELIGPDDIERTAEFEIRDGRITAFAIRPFTDA